jgi:CHAT domain-containing protein/Tfp pilus assembly protein PilF
MYERTVGADSPDLAWELNNYGLLFWRLGDFEAGRPLFERALGIWTRAGSPDASRALNNLAITFRRLGDFSAARRNYEQSLAIKELTLGPDHPDVALVLFNTANLLRDMGDAAAARPMYERALRIREVRLGSTHPLTAFALNGLSEAMSDLGEPVVAASLAERALAIWRGNKSPEAAIGLSTLARLSLDSGDLATALRRYDEARAIYEKTFGPEYVEIAAIMNNSASTLARRGDYSAARRGYSRALEILERQFSPEHPSVAEVTAGLAHVEWQLGDTARAIEYALRSERISRDHFRLTSTTLSEREAVSFSETRAPALDVLMTLAVAGNLSTDERRMVMDAAIRSRALVLDEVTQRTRVRADRAAKGQGAELVAAVSRARQRLANLIVRGPRPGETGYRARVDGARAEREAAERALAAASLVQRDQLKREHAGLAEVVAALPDEAAVVTFVAYDHLARGAPRAASGRPVGDRRYAALLLNRAGEVTVISIGGARAVDAQVERWRQAIHAMARTGASPESAYRRVAGALARTVWDPVAAHVATARQVFLVPDGSLNLLSFASLPDTRSRGYLLEKSPLIHYLSAERDLVRTAAERSAGGLLALGNPVYSRADPARTVEAPAGELRGALACPEFQRVRFAQLPAADREVEDLVALWRLHGGSAVERLSGARATETAFKQSAAGRRILHLATHGFFLGSCSPAAGGTRGVGGLAARAVRNKPAPQDALALSGLAFAGANHRSRASASDDDGILTAEEVSGLDLREVEWAVLSACDTGVGEVRAGEGVFGLRRAFATAGVRTTIMSLWSVDDQSTREWMGALYNARLLGGRSTSEAVRDAGLAVLRSRRARGLGTHPFDWAAFVAAGDWR